MYKNVVQYVKCLFVLVVVRVSVTDIKTKDLCIVSNKSVEIYWHRFFLLIWQI